MVTTVRAKILFWGYLAWLVVLFGTAINNADPDLWQRFTLVDYLCKTGHFPAADTFGYLAYPEVRPDHEWGSGVILYATYLWGGGPGLVLLKLVTLGATLALTVRAGLGTRPPTMLDAFFYSVVLLALLASFLSTLRSEVSTHIFLALWILWFQQERRGARIPALAYGLVMAAWTNLHGGFILGFVWLGVIGTIEFLTGGNWKRRAGIFFLCLLATLVNPFGYKLWDGVFQVISIPRPGFEEWAPVPWFHDVGQFAGYRLLVLWALVVIFNHVRRLGWRNCDHAAVVMIALFLVPSLVHSRYTSLFAVVAAGLLPPLFPPETKLEEIREWKPWLHRFLVRAVLVLLPLVYAVRLLPSNEGFKLVYPPDTCPVKAVAYLYRSGATGRLLVDFNSGSYAMWQLRGRMRVSMDGRYEVAYSYESFAKVARFFAAEGPWRDALDNPRPDAVLVDIPDPVYPRMLAEPGWVQAYHDEIHAVFQPAR